MKRSAYWIGDPISIPGSVDDNPQPSRSTGCEGSRTTSLRDGRL